MSNTTESGLHGPAACPRACSGCDGGHHWIEDGMDWLNATEEEIEDAGVPSGDPRRVLECWFSCKHCPAWATCEYVWDLEEADDDDPASPPAKGGGG